MTSKLGGASVLALLIGMLLGSGASADEPPTPKQSPVAHALGTFTVALRPEAMADTTAGEMLSRLSVHKQLEGDLTATSSGEMLGARTAVEGSAGYVAIERITGTLQGKTGSFVLQHSGTMSHGALQLVITIVPDSGTGELAGIAGAMRIKIEGSKHFYELEYTLPTP